MCVCRGGCVCVCVEVYEPIAEWRRNSGSCNSESSALSYSCHCMSGCGEGGSHRLRPVAEHGGALWRVERGSFILTWYMLKTVRV